MASSEASSEFITGVTVTIDEALYKDTSLLKGILQDYSVRKKGSCYHVTGSYQEIEDLCMTLSTLQQHTPSTKYENPTLPQHTPSTKYENPTLQQHTPSTKYENPTLPQHTPSTKYENPTLQQHTPSTKYENPTLQQHTPSTKYENPTLQQHTPSTKYENPTLQQHTPSTKYENPTLQQHTPSTKYENPTVPQHTPSTKYENPTLPQHTPSTKYENPTVPQHTPSTKYEDLSRKQASNKYESSNHQGKHVSTPALQLEVAGVVMDYIKQKRSKEIDRIQGSDFWIDAHSSPGRARSDPAGKTVVTFKPRHRDISQARAHFIRERFITFYQRIATDLQVRTLDVHPQDYKDLQRTFSELLIEPDRSKGKVKVTGPFVQILRLEDVLRGGSSTPRDRLSPRLSSPPHSAGGVASSTSPTHSRQPEGDETCAICMDTINVKETLRCKHSFCKDCLEQAFEYKPVCPTCGALYGALKGTQPEGGTMTIAKESSSLPGYEKYKTIVIHYYIPSGIQKEEHPSPGHRYDGASRTAYLPDSSEGRRVLDLLRRAFDQRLIFTIGQSSTSGRTNVVTWNDIHHKTSVHGGPTCYGFPDPEYLHRVKDELKVKGIE